MATKVATPAKRTAAKSAPKSTTKGKPSTAMVKTSKNRALAQSGGLGFLSTVAGKGTENITTQDKGMPYLKLLQDLSPETKKRNEKYVEGAVPGSFLLTSNREVFDGEVTIVPIYFKSIVQEWWPRNHKNNGLVRTSDTMSEAKAAKREADTVLSLTHLHFVLVWSNEAEKWEPCIMAFDRTKLSPSKDLIRLIDNYRLEFDGEEFKAPAFARSYNLTAQETEKGGYNYWTLSVAPSADVYEDEDFMVYCNGLVDEFARGAVKVDYSAGEGHASSTDDDDVDEDDV